MNTYYVPDTVPSVKEIIVGKNKVPVLLELKFWEKDSVDDIKIFRSWILVAKHFHGEKLARE